MTTDVGCPYCIVAGFAFQRMAKNSYQEYVCPTCGHVEHPQSECGCDRCQQNRRWQEMAAHTPALTLAHY
jgi:ssDNA-binding Zn-finger/Zn-ribbon topoisomerase 1